ncbi:hypothetical protein EOC94_02825 [Mesorhizobium sp. M6A.T.Ce.TU.016.01.1.1]|nr:hypothetical protein EOC94_02825 [Mesorhizobium sp. M6A.T.Ce.TU.016.01.1.1]
MASAVAKGLGGPVLATDGGSGRAAALVAAVGGEVPSSNAELAKRADIVILCHPPEALSAVASEIADHARLVVSLLAKTDHARLAALLPTGIAVRAMTNLAVELRQGVTCLAAGAGTEQAGEVFARLGEVVVLPENEMAVTSALIGVAPAYVAFLIEAQADAAVAYGVSKEVAIRIARGTFAGSAALLRERGDDPRALTREVVTPGGPTSRGLHVLEEYDVRAALRAALDAVRRRD